MKSRWWSQPSEELEAFATEVASFHVPVSKEPAANELKHRAEHKKAILKTAEILRELEAIPSSKHRASLLNACIKRPYVRRAAVMIAAYTRRNRTEQLSMKQIKCRAKECESTHSLSEAVKYTPIPKGDGTTRDAWDFGPVRYAQQVLMRWLIETSIKAPCYDYSYPGRGGIRGSAKAIRQSLKAGYQFWTTTDIKSAFPSITRKHFRKLFPDVGKRLERYLVFPTLPYNTATIEPTQRELPQGGAHSSLILSAMIDGCLADLSLGDVMVVVFADNIAIGAHTESEAKSAFRAVKKALANSLSGFELHTPYLCDGFHHAEFEPPIPTDGFKCVNSIDFCGYRLSKDISTSVVRIRPSAKAWRKFWTRFDQEHFSEHWTLKALQTEAIQRVMIWRCGLSLWKPNASAREINRINSNARFGDRLFHPCGPALPSEVGQTEDS